MSTGKLCAFDRAPLWLLTVCAYLSVCSSSVRAESTAFFYGADVPRELLTVYDQVVVEPSYVTDLATLAHSHAALVACVSIGQVAESDARPIDRAWVIGRNSAWATRIMDLTQAGYRRFVLDHIEALWRAGYRRFYLDTLDSYELASLSPQLKAAQVQGLTAFILALTQRHPDARLLLHNGFELLPWVASQVHGVVAGSLFDGWDEAQRAYVSVPERQGRQLYERLREVRERYGLPVIVIDYRAPREREQARQTARKIAELGFTPWVCGSHLSDVGVGELEILPRRVLIVTDQNEAEPGIARWLAPVLEYLGYMAEYSAPATVTTQRMTGRYAGIISVLKAADVGAGYESWLRAQLVAGVRVAIFGELGFGLNSRLAHELGIRPLQPSLPGQLPPLPVEWSARDQLIGFEADPQLHALQGAPLALEGATARHLELRLANGEIATAVATAPWGGLARSHVLALRGMHGQRAWVLDPFAFLTSALALPLMPVPDVTTESGARVAFFAIDVEGAGRQARMRGRPLVSEQLFALLSAQRWPHALGTRDKSDGADVAALQQLLNVPGVYPDAIRTGTTTAHHPLASLTQVAPLYSVGAPDPIAAPVAPDSAFLEGAGDSYAFSRVLGTFAFTDAPRRISPIALQYHAYAAGSPGGVDALTRIYEVLSRTPLFVVRVNDYRQRIRAFRQQVIARDLEGDYHVRGGEALRTLRVPAELGAIDIAASSGVAAVSTLAQGRYVTFAADSERRLRFGGVGPRRAYLEQSNGRVERFRSESSTPGRTSVAFAASAAEPLVLRFAGLPAGALCALTYQNELQRMRSDNSGRAQFVLTTANTGDAALLCPAP